MSRAYLRLDPGLFERKAIQQGYSLGELAAYVVVLCLAETQPERGRFRDERLLRALLGKAGGQLPALLERRDVVLLPDGRLYVDGWDEWQEGDVTVRDRMARLRDRRKRNADRNGHRNEPYSGDKAVGIAGQLPPPPTSGGRRSEGTNPRATGDAPRQTGDNPRATGTSPPGNQMPALQANEPAQPCALYEPFPAHPDPPRAAHLRAARRRMDRTGRDSAPSAALAAHSGCVRGPHGVRAYRLRRGRRTRYRRPRRPAQSHRPRLPPLAAYRITGRVVERRPSP